MGQFIRNLLHPQTRLGFIKGVGSNQPEQTYIQYVRMSNITSFRVEDHVHYSGKYIESSQVIATINPINKFTKYSSNDHDNQLIIKVFFNKQHTHEDEFAYAFKKGGSVCEISDNPHEDAEKYLHRLLSLK